MVIKKAGWLKIYSRDGFSGDKAALSRGVVFCPFQGTDLDVDECRACEYCDGIALDPTGRNSFLMCNRPLSEALEEHQVHDPFERVQEPERSPDCFKTPIRELMTNLVVTVSEDLTVEELTRLFVERGISGVPVIDADRRVQGVVSKTDLLQAIANNQGFEKGNESVAQMTVREVMTPVSMALPDHATVGRAAALMSYEGIHRLPVIDEHERVIGLLSAIDILRWIAREDGYRVPGYTQQQGES